MGKLPEYALAFDGRKPARKTQTVFEWVRTGEHVLTKGESQKQRLWRERLASRGQSATISNLCRSDPGHRQYLPFHAPSSSSSCPFWPSPVGGSPPLHRREKKGEAGGRGTERGSARWPEGGLAGCTANARPAVDCKAAVWGMRRGSHPSPKQELAFSMARVQM